jgi:hypothetical protein
MLFKFLIFEECKFYFYNITYILKDKFFVLLFLIYKIIYFLYSKSISVSLIVFFCFFVNLFSNFLKYLSVNSLISSSVTDLVNLTFLLGFAQPGTFLFTQDVKRRIEIIIIISFPMFFLFCTQGGTRTRRVLLTTRF